MEILEGLFFINDLDAYDTYGVFLSEENPGDMENYNSLMKPAESKGSISGSMTGRNTLINLSLLSRQGILNSALPLKPMTRLIFLPGGKLSSQPSAQGQTGG